MPEGRQGGQPGCREAGAEGGGQAVPGAGRHRRGRGEGEVREAPQLHGRGTCRLARRRPGDIEAAREGVPEERLTARRHPLQFPVPPLRRPDRARSARRRARAGLDPGGDPRAGAALEGAAPKAVE